ncbi:integral membrane protein [Fusarium mundagurra]|uniref:Integral membrane protein n=1 Tax=Fusarium mundagurra TaxID=1567541 RepID=A0A8H5YVG3_9HYPO|nr:integral membrane protein [Fusarium mundagurra]
MAPAMSTLSDEGSLSQERQHVQDENDVAVPSSPLLESRSRSPAGLRAKLGLGGVARRTLGFALLLLTVLLWTLYNFIASYMFSDQTYNKPFFIVYLNTSIFAISLIPKFFKYLRSHGFSGMRHDATQLWSDYKHGRINTKSLYQTEDEQATERLISQGYGGTETATSEEKLTFKETAVLSFEFCMLWFSANYFASACLEYTSVASVTILTSTSSVWTLIFCSLFGIERFSTAKILGVGASLAGVILISTVDLSGKSDEDRGSFPHKSPTQIAVGDSMALLSAVIYGLYVTVMKRKVPNEDKVDMQMFFGLVGVFNVVLLWPIFFILHWTGLEPFELPPSSTLWGIIIFNAVSSFISDISWALALLMTTPLVVTVGLSLTIPLSLIGEILQYQQYSSFTYWVGAAVVFVSFIVVSRESGDGEEPKKDDDLERSVGV